MKIRRILPWILCAVMVLSMIPAAIVATGAAEPDEGMWTTHQGADSYPREDDDPYDVYPPESGYEYTSEGFSVVQPDWTDVSPFVTVSTKEPQPIKEGIYLKFRVDDYSYGGDICADHWLCLSLNTGYENTGKIQPGSSFYGGGWLALLRGEGDGNVEPIPHLTDPKTEDFGGTFIPQGWGFSAPAELDDEGREIYTLEVSWNGSVYEIKVNGVAMPSASDTTALLEKLSPSGDFFVGITMYTNIRGGSADLTILEYGTSEATAKKPAGNDSKEPEENECREYPIADPDTVPENTPAILWSPETYTLKSGNNINFTPKDDNTWQANATEDYGVFFNLRPKKKWSYDATDFPVVGIMFRNLWVEDGTLWYAAGEYPGATNGLHIPFSIYDGVFYGEDEEYVFVPYDLTGLWEGRINAIRLDMAIDDETCREFDLCFAGMFRSEEEAYAYAKSYLAERGVCVHEYENHVVAATCTEYGYTVHTCVRCGEEYTDSYRAPLGHRYTEQVIPPTCTDYGYTTYTCTRCWDKYSDAFRAPLDHCFTAQVTPPTCTEQGYTTQTCDRCGDSYTDSRIPAKGHTPGDAATCTHDQICLHCDEVLQPAKGHSYTEQVTPPTCTEQGYTTKTCTNCGDAEKNAYQPAKGHTPGDAASCVKDQLCTVCGAVLQNAIGHNYIPKSVSPTCVEKGYTEHTCTRCGDAYRDAEIAAKGHTASDWIVDAEPAVGVPGERHKKCTVCGENMESETIPALEEQTTLEPDSVDTPDEPVVTDEVTKEDTPVPGTTEPETTESELNSGSAGCAGALGLGEMTLFMILAAACLVTRKRSKE